MHRCLFLQPLLSFAQWAHEQSSHDNKDESYAWGPQYRLLLTKADLATAVAECQVCQQQRRTQSPPNDTISWCQNYYV